LPQKNYQKELDALLQSHTAAGETPSLLLHSCCGPCSSYVLEYLAAFFHITLLYYNPNILPAAEYHKRLDTQKQLLRLLPAANPIVLLEGDYAPEEFLCAVKGLENEPEGGARCEVCFRLRLGESAKIAKARGCDYFGTTLSVSPHKNAQLLAEIAAQLSAEYGVKALPADFKKRGGCQRSVLLAGQFGLYRQDFCGCPFSMREERGGEGERRAT